MKYGIPASLLFMALSLGSLLYFQNWPSVAAFTVSTLGLAFLSYLTRQADERLEAIHSEITTLKAELSSLAMRLGWGG